MAIGQTSPTFFRIENVIDLATHADRAPGPPNECLRCIQCVAGSSTAVHTARLGGSASHAHDFRAVAANHRGRSDGQQSLQCRVAVRRSARAHGFQHGRNAPLGGRRQCQLHAPNPIGVERANVDHQRFDDGNHVAHFLMSMRHHGRSTCSQQYIGVEINRHHIANAMYQGRLLTNSSNICPNIRGRKSGGHF